MWGKEWKELGLTEHQAPRVPLSNRYRSLETTSGFIKQVGYKNIVRGSCNKNKASLLRLSKSNEMVVWSGEEEINHRMNKNRQKGMSGRDTDRVSFITGRDMV